MTSYYIPPLFTKASNLNTLSFTLAKSLTMTSNSCVPGSFCTSSTPSLQRPRRFPNMLIFQPVPEPLNAVLRDLRKFFFVDLGLVEPDGDFPLLHIDGLHTIHTADEPPERQRAFGAQRRVNFKQRYFHAPSPPLSTNPFDDVRVGHLSDVPAVEERGQHLRVSWFSHCNDRLHSVPAPQDFRRPSFIRSNSSLVISPLAYLFFRISRGVSSAPDCPTLRDTAWTMYIIPRITSAQKIIMNIHPNPIPHPHP